MENDICNHVSSLYFLTIKKIAPLILKTWDFKFHEINNIQRANEDCSNYFEFPCDICFHIICSMVLQTERLSFGQSIWIMESHCNRLYKRWLLGINLGILCEVASDKAKNSIMEFFVAPEDDISDVHFAKHFPNLTRLKICENNQVTDWQLREIVSNCHLLQDVNLKGCNNITDDFIESLWRMRSAQKNLRILDISNTSISGRMAATLYFLLPQLLLLLYDNIASFLRYRCVAETNENLICNRLVHTVRLGDAGDHRLRFVTEDDEPYKVMELSLPNYDMPPFDEEGSRNMFWFVEDDHESFNFQDIYLAMCSVAPHETFGVSPEKSYLRELSLTSVKNIDLNVLFSHFPRLRNICFWRDCSILNSGKKFHLGQSVTDVEFWFVPSLFINQTLKHCPNVEYLTIRCVKVDAETFKNVNFSTMKAVEFYRCEGCLDVQDAFPKRTRVDIY